METKNGLYVGVLTWRNDLGASHLGNTESLNHSGFMTVEKSGRNLQMVVGSPRFPLLFPPTIIHPAAVVQMKYCRVRHVTPV